MSANENPKGYGYPEPVAFSLKPVAFPRCPHRHGVALIVVAVLLIVFIGFLGLAVDWIYTVRTAQQLQTAADASALAGARVLLSASDAEAAVDKAVEIAQLNYAAQEEVILVPAVGFTSGDVQIGRYHRVSSSNPTAWFEPTLNSPNSVKTIANRTTNNPKQELGLFFGPIFKVPTVPITRDAVAMRGPGAAILVLDPTNDPCACMISGQGNTAKLDVENGAVQINSPAVPGKKGGAFCFNGNQRISADAFNVVGDVQPNFDKFVDADGPVRTNQPPLPDPLAYLRNFPIPPNDFGTKTAAKNGDQTLAEGYYPAGINVNGGNLVLGAGVYVCDNGFSVGGNGSLQGQGVLIYVRSGELQLGGSGNVRLTEYTGPYGGGKYRGLVIWQAFGNTNTATIGGTGYVDVHGTLYFPEAGMNGGDGLILKGTGDSFGTQIITYKLSVQGTGAVRIDYDGRNNNMTNVFLVK